VVDGVPARKRRFAGGASGIDCSTLVPSSMSTSPSSDEGKSRTGGDDIVNGVRVQHRRRREQDAFNLSLGRIDHPSHEIFDPCIYIPLNDVVVSHIIRQWY
jgi:hypothetical protein